MLENHQKQPSVLPIINLINKNNIIEKIKDNYIDKVDHDIKFEVIQKEINNINANLNTSDFFDYINIRIIYLFIYLILK